MQHQQCAAIRFTGIETSLLSRIQRQEAHRDISLQCVKLLAPTQAVAAMQVSHRSLQSHSRACISNTNSITLDWQAEL